MNLALEAIPEDPGAVMDSALAFPIDANRAARGVGYDMQRSELEPFRSSNPG